MFSGLRSWPRRTALVTKLPAILAAIVSAWPSIAWSGAWARDPGEAYAKASVSVLRADEMYDRDSGQFGPLFDPALYRNGRYTETGSALYLEYGLFRTLTVLGSLPLKLVEQEAEGVSVAGDLHGETFGFGDLHLGARVPVLRGRWVAAIEPNLKIPLRRAPEAGSTDPSLSTGFADFGASFCLGGSLPRIRSYGQASVGYRIRSGTTPEEGYWDVEVGIEPVRALRARFRYDGVRSEREQAGGVDAGGINAPVPNAGGQDFHRIAPTLALGLGGYYELALTWRRVVDGRSALRSSEWEVGFSFLGRVVPAPEL